MTTKTAPTNEAPHQSSAELDDKPPVLGSWRNIYVGVLGVLVVVVALFAVLTEVYS